MMVEQHGFQHKVSCLTDLISFLDKVTGKTGKSERAEVCYLNIQVFDSVIYRHLDQKLRAS